MKAQFLYVCILNLILSMSLYASQGQSNRKPYEPFQQAELQKSSFDELPLELQLKIITPVLNSAQSIEELNEELKSLSRVYKGAYNALVSEPVKDVRHAKARELVEKRKIELIQEALNSMYCLLLNYGRCKS